MKLNRLALISAIISSSAGAFEICKIGDEYNVLDSESFHQIRQKNYDAFSDGITPENLFPSAPEHIIDLKPSLSEASDILPETATLLDTGPASAIAIEPIEATRLMETLGRSTSSLAKGALEALGPIGDAVAVGLWANDVANSFQDESRTSYDRFATVMELVDWFGVLKLPAREIDRQILSSRWDRIAAGDHYSYRVHDDLITQQDLRDKNHWAELASDQQAMWNAVARGFATDLALKYQQHYQEVVKAQTIMAEELITAVDHELRKAMFSQLALDHKDSRLFASDIAASCNEETRVLADLYPEHDAEESNSLPPALPSKRQANRALAKLQHCQQNLLDQAIAKLNELRTGQIEGLDQAAVQQLYTRTLAAKTQIIETADNHVNLLKSKLQKEMFTQGEIAVERLFRSGSVETMHNFFKGQAERNAIDEMTRSILGRPATTQEIRNKEIILQSGYRKCVRIGILGGDPNFRGCVEYAWIPAETRPFNPSEDTVIAQIYPPNKEAVKRVLFDTLSTLIADGWNSEDEEHWLEQQILNFSAQQRLKQQAEFDKQQVYHWLLDSSAMLEGECGGGSACAGWSLSYLQKENLSRQASLHYINNWHANYSGKGAYVHSKRYQKLGGLITAALESEWQAKRAVEFYSFTYPGSIDLQKNAPLIYSALKSSSLDLAHLEGNTLQLAKGIVKTRLAEAISVSDSNGVEWLHSQVGQFQRYTSIIHSQHISTGHYASGEGQVTALFSEMLPAHLMRYLISDIIPDSYDARIERSIDAIFNPTSELNQQLDKLSNTNENFTDKPGRSCIIYYPYLKSALLDVAADDDLYWISPISEWYDAVTRQQLNMFGALKYAVINQNTFGIPCDLSPNSYQYQ
ncbi:hypothetical protein [Vibrio lentus]|uniref:Uncharacterized protein n=1 Tax=Vibrio lentus TaxID=136468 RepID=A0A855IJ31_9VIBR|nr:hypothetical protein [Vibrio lentus]PMM53340.1 hypothetical protein BCT51_15560 [Vibrio lentus]PMM53639.1 hypothetical protein BCT50_14495 [Vibrio lentus]